MPRFPYVASRGPLASTIQQLRRSFPSELTAQTLKKLNLAPNNESYIINTLRFIGIIDEAGGRRTEQTKCFNQTDAAAFAREFAPLVQAAYSELFELRGDEAWTLNTDALETYFRNADDTSQVVGRRQAGTFAALAELAGRRDGSSSARQAVAKPEKQASRRSRAAERGAMGPAVNAEPVHGATDGSLMPETRRGVDVSLAVRVEVNLPATTDQAVYDSIFRSIRENLFDA